MRYLKICICFLFLQSCLGWLDDVKTKRMKLNDEYDIVYQIFNKKHIHSMAIMKANSDKQVRGNIVEILYNDNYIFCRAQFRDDFGESVYKINMNPEDIGNYMILYLDTSEVQKMIDECVDCKRIELSDLELK